ncbi:PEP-CTERM sorting domain-containing protein [Chitinolyticbacter albus]|uniref:PEP-CTERM sorting domain-containing protein n=1 Tax=Chitinolyticbacter albus TaxID=2961951 RepID=UPI00210BE4C8|nr:PEP-CTERM sorting domain-containing protein [Chitinolyticbacter albus]
MGKLFETVYADPLFEATTETRPYLYTQTFQGAFGGPEQVFYSSLKAWQMGCCNSFTVPEIELSFVANPVPEPETYALMGTGLLAGLLVRRRQQVGKSHRDEVRA